MSVLPWPQRWFMAEAEAHIAYGLEGWANPKICGLLAVTWLTKALKA